MNIDQSTKLTAQMLQEDPKEVARDVILGYAIEILPDLTKYEVREEALQALATFLTA